MDTTIGCVCGHWPKGNVGMCDRITSELGELLDAWNDVGRGRHIRIGHNGKCFQGGHEIGRATG